MNRTRIVFFGFVAVFLALIVIGLLAQGLSQQFVQQLFVGTAVFGVGVVLLDMLGLLGHHAADAGGGNAHDAGGVVGHTAGHIDGVGHVDHAGDASATGHADASGHAADHASDGHAAHDHAHMQEESQISQGVVSALAFLRLFVYFCLGFGPMGWAAMASGWGALRGLAVAAPVGVVAVFLAQAFFRFQRKDTDSTVAPDELVSQDAVVLVPLDDTNMGKVRVQIGMNVSDLYALASGPGRAYDKGQHVRIQRVTDECVYVN